MGSGFKTFTAGAVLTASDVNNYLMEQSVMYFATTAARDLAITAPEEGMTAFIGSNDDDEGLYGYDGSKWIQLGARKFIDAASTTTTPTAAATVIYTQASLTITPGTWLVQAHGNILNFVTTDTCRLEIYNNTTSAVVANSAGCAFYTNTANSVQVDSRTVQITVTANTSLSPIAICSGGSTVKFAGIAQAPAGIIEAFRIR